MATQMELPAGKTRCFAVSPTMRFFVDRETGEASKLIVAMKVETPHGQVEHAEFMTVDPSAVTNRGKARIEFTLAALRTLGAQDPAGDIADALDAGAAEVTFRWADAVDWAPCTVVHNGQYVNLNVGSIDIDASKAKRASSAIRRLAAPRAAVNPFEARGVPVPTPGSDGDENPF